MSSEEGISKCLKSRKLSLYLLLGTIYVAFIGFELGRIQAIADFNYTLHEILFLPLTIAYIIVPLEFLVFFYFVIKCNKVRKINITEQNLLKAILIILTLIIIISIFVYQQNEENVTGIYRIEEKIREENYYYIILNDRKVKCTQNEYNLINDNKEYLIIYTWNNYSPQKGKLDYIKELTD